MYVVLVCHRSKFFTRREAFKSPAKFYKILYTRECIRYIWVHGPRVCHTDRRTWIPGIHCVAQTERMASPTRITQALHLHSSDARSRLRRRYRARDSECVAYSFRRNGQQDIEELAAPSIAVARRNIEATANDSSRVGELDRTYSVRRGGAWIRIHAPPPARTSSAANLCSSQSSGCQKTNQRPHKQFGRPRHNAGDMVCCALTNEFTENLRESRLQNSARATDNC